MNDLRTFITDLAERKPNMRLYSLAQEIKKFEKNQQIAEENYRRQLAYQVARDQQNIAAQYPYMQFRVSPPRRGFFARLRTQLTQAFNGEME